MRIRITERLRPFSHLPGTATILPGSYYQIRIFPCSIQIYDLSEGSSAAVATLFLDLKGPVTQFTVCNDLEKGRIAVSGHTTEGWIRYHLVSAIHGNGICLKVEKAPSHGFTVTTIKGSHFLQSKNELNLLENEENFEPYIPSHTDRLSLGNHKAQDWDLVKRRLDLQEILPFIHRLGQLLPSLESMPHEIKGNLILLKQCEESLSSNRPDEKEADWKNFLLGCFHQLLVPRLQDSDYLGLIPLHDEVKNVCPLILLKEGSQLIRKLFIQQEQSTLSILPFLLPSLHCGRLIDVEIEGGKISLEWSKKTIRRLIFRPCYDQEWRIRFRPDVKSYRLRKSLQDRSVRKNCGESLFLEKNCQYLFDNFQ